MSVRQAFAQSFLAFIKSSFKRCPSLFRSSTVRSGTFLATKGPLLRSKHALQHPFSIGVAAIAPSKEPKSVVEKIARAIRLFLVICPLFVLSFANILPQEQVFYILFYFN